MKKFTLNKSDKLCSPIAIDSLFSNGASSASDNISSAIAYPLRAVWKTYESAREGSHIKFLISVPKKRLRHAVDRVKMRRRTREAFRLNRHQFTTEKYIDLAFIYIANDLKDYHTVEKSVCKLLEKIHDHEKIS